MAAPQQPPGLLATGLGLFDFLGGAARNTIANIASALSGAPATKPVVTLDPRERISGRALLEQLGVLAENQPGLDVGDVLGFGVELITDPLNLISGGVLASGAKAALKQSLKKKAADKLTRATALLHDAGIAARRPKPIQHHLLSPRQGFATPPFEAAQVFPKKLYEEHNIAKQMLERMGIEPVWFQTPPHSQALAGFAPGIGQPVGQVALNPRVALNDIPAIAAHEAFHTLARTKPEMVGALQKLFNKASVSGLSKNLQQKHALYRKLDKAGLLEEATATMISDILESPGATTIMRKLHRREITEEAAKQLMKREVWPIAGKGKAPDRLASWLVSHIQGRTLKDLMYEPTGEIVSRISQPQHRLSPLQHYLNMAAAGSLTGGLLSREMNR